MEATNQFLFVYGTLLQPGNELAEYLNQHCKFVSNGKIKGRLYDIGEYPGAVIDDQGELFVYGSVFMIVEPGTTLKLIDEYEEVGALYKYPQEYIRKQVNILTDNGNINCWIYVYNWPVNSYRQIIDGDYMQYLNSAAK